MGRRRPAGRQQKTGALREHRARKQLSRMGHWRADGSAKVKFASEDDANRSAFRLRMEMHLDLEVYKCDICGYWHLGSSPG